MPPIISYHVSHWPPGESLTHADLIAVAAHYSYDLPAMAALEELQYLRNITAGEEASVITRPYKDRIDDLMIDIDWIDDELADIMDDPALAEDGYLRLGKLREKLAERVKNYG